MRVRKWSIRLRESVSLLRPRTVFSKGISGAGRWGPVRYSAFEQPSFCTVLEGRCLLAVDGEEAVTLRGVERLGALVKLVGEEASERRSGRDLVLARLVEVLLIEALRSKPDDDAPPGLLRGMADTRMATAMRHIHGEPARSWTVAQLAEKVALSRSAFFDRFTRAVGLPPMEYLLAWRMALAKDFPPSSRGYWTDRGR